MTYYIIGTGNMAWFLGTKLKAAGHKCAGVYGRNKDNATKLSEEISGELILNINDLNDNQNICILAISDDAIEEFVQQLSFKNTLLIHTAGAMPINTLSKASNKQGVIWPIYSITKGSITDNTEIPCVIEYSDKDSKEALLEIARSFSNNIKEVTSEQRQQLHLTAVISNNFSNHLYTICEQLLAEHNLSIDLLLPIIYQTISRLKERSPYDMQTGPAKRHDLQTINKQLKVLQNHPEWAKIYDAISRSIETMYK